MKPRGIGLLETLSTVLIVTFGLVGLANLQTKNIAYVNNSYSLLKSSFYADELMQKITNNLTLAKSDPSPYVLASFTDTPSVQATSACITTDCTPDQLAVFDMSTWLFKVKNGLPNGKARVTKDTSGSSVLYTIEIQWQYKTDTKNYKFVGQL